MIMLCGVREYRSRGYAEQQDFLVQFCGQHWSLPACLSWSRTREFTGNVFRPLWTSAEYRQHKANDVFRRWAPLLSHLSLPIHERMEAFRISVGSSVLWFCKLLDIHENTDKQARPVVCSPAVSNGLWQAQAIRTPCGTLDWFSRSTACCNNIVLLVTLCGQNRNLRPTERSRPATWRGGDCLIPHTQD